MMYINGSKSARMINLSNSFGNINELQGTKLAQARLLSKNFLKKYFRPYKVGMSDHSRSLNFNAEIYWIL